MQKILALVFVLVLTVSLCACGVTPQGTQANPTTRPIIQGPQPETQLTEPFQPTGQTQATQSTQASQTTQPAEPTAEEQGQLRQYVEIAQALNRYVTNPDDLWVREVKEDGNLGPIHEDQTALRFCYEKLLTLTAVEKWAGSDYVAQNIYGVEEVSWDRQGLLAAFTVVEDVLLSMTEFSEDHLGNVSKTEEIGFWEYDASGRVLRSRDPVTDCEVETVVTDGECFVYEYDDQGRPVRATGHEYWYGHIDEDIYCLRDYAYSDDGTRMTMTITTNTDVYVVEYTYDAQGRLAECTSQLGNSYRYVTQYSYDDAGHLIQTVDTTYCRDFGMEPELLEKIETKTYVYDENGTLVSAVIEIYNARTDKEDKAYENRIEYACDEQGRVLQEKIIYSEEVSYSEVYTIYQYHYGDYYIYAPVN